MTNQINRILVADDLSDESLKVLHTAAFMAQTFSATLKSVYVDDLPPLAPSPAAMAARAFQTAELPGPEYYQELMVQRITAAGASIARADAFIVQGTAGESTCEVALNEDVDLIVVGTHQRRGLSRLFLGSTADEIVKHAPCAVLLVPCGDPAGVAQELATEVPAQTRETLALG